MERVLRVGGEKKQAVDPVELTCLVCAQPTSLSKLLLHLHIHNINLKPQQHHVKCPQQL